MNDMTQELKERSRENRRRRFARGGDKASPSGPKTKGRYFGAAAVTTVSGWWHATMSCLGATPRIVRNSRMS